MDYNNIFLQQAEILDPDGLYRLKDTVQNIINQPFQLFLLQVISHNINNNLKKDISETKKDYEIIISKLMASINNLKGDYLKEYEIEKIIESCKFFSDEFADNIKKKYFNKK